MNEVEKMYENAGVEKEIIPCPAKYYGYDCTRNNWDDEDCSCDIDGYPPFTAEKQLELIKWLARKGLIQINYSSHQCYQFNSFRIGGDYKTDISEALASHCNNLWQDLTEEERKQIKEILE
ncbi:hypothetical protein [Faecalibacillus faecis]|uniref:hypothetical protein n=1 Tax=Faecalibacillus faecis TaxID=1982628 RepID=UPI0038660247